MSDERDQRLATAKQAEQVMRDDYLAVLSTTAGRRLLARILRRCAVAAPVFASDPLVMAHAEGRRSIGIELVGEIRTCCATSPDHWRQLRDELDKE